ncbi:MAG: peptidase C11 [Erysipelotrichaceae bacterium]|nr:peptidase C11 [Erysipelotrichaceae bacterium]
MSNRPHSREKQKSGKQTTVYKREKAGGFNQRVGSSSNVSRTMRNTGGIGSIIIFLLMIFFGIGNSGNQTTQTINPSQQTSTSYENVNSLTANKNVSSDARKKYTNILGSDDEVTIMVYMIGSDLESNYGMATKDINEMLYATIGENVNIILETGGAKKWNNNVISAKSNQRYLISNQGMMTLDKNVGLKSMTDPKTLTDFVKYSVSNYPANRYMLIMWDHGGGSVSGFGYDQYFPKNTMTIDQISQSLKDANVKFDIIGFDACLMATLETAVALEPYSDYLLASEELEPGNGWYYTNWITKLSENTSIHSVDLGKIIIDDFISESSKASRRDKLTLSIVDLAELNGVMKKHLPSFSVNLSELVKGDDYKVVSNARSTSREFAQSQKLDQVDLVDFANKIGTTESKELASAISEAVKYNRTNNVTNAYGLSIYFPYSSLSKMNSMVKIYDNIDMNTDFSDAVKSYATLSSSGQIVAQNNGSSSTSLIDTLLGNYSSGSTSSSNDILSLLTNSMSNQNSGVGMNTIMSLLGGGDWNSGIDLNTISQFIGRNQVDTTQLELTNVNDQQVLILSEEQWELISTIEFNVFVDDGEGYIDLGLDNVFEFNEDNDLIVDYDNTWLALNDNVVSYKFLSDEVSGDTYKISGYIPAYLNDEFVHIMVEFSDINPSGEVLKAKKVYDDVDLEAKGMIEIQDGDKLEFTAEYHSYDGSITDRYFISDPYIVSGDLNLSNITLTNTKIVYSYRLTDIYNNSFWLPVQKTY